MPIRMLKVTAFNRWAKDAGLGDDDLQAAAREIENGLVDARLGGFLIKKRVAAGNRGRRGGYMVGFAYRQGDRLLFLHGFAKSERDNITPLEKKALQMQAAHYMTLSEDELSRQVEKGLLFEVPRP